MPSTRPHYVNFAYDPKRQGYDTSIWKTLSGTPAVSNFDFAGSEYDSMSIGESVTSLGSAGYNSVADTGSISDVPTVTRT